ncbi:immunoglobulin superfamily member 10-like [Ostrinia nubilalis]|uniref:immunoglobulin superfamily member 10-like n=1 Tax=Ostrinia nubilalis TaxID=29057 RepID=UPI00308259A0
MIMKREAIISFAIAVLVWEKSQACFHESIEREMIYEKTGTPYYLECTCNEPGYDTSYITWLDNNDTVVREQRPGIEHSVFTVTDHHTVSLNIPYLSKKTSGTYKCQTNFEGNKYIQTYHITAYDPITINPPVKQFLLLGNRSLIRCEVHAEPDANLIVTWHKVEGDRLVQINTDATYTIMPEGLYINKVEEKDKGIYSCAVLESKTMDEVDINIYTEIITKPVIKRVKAVPESTVVVGDRLVLECDAEGTPHPEYIWRKVDEPVTENPPRWKQQINALVMESIQPQDSGVYECVAQSNAGVVSETIDIQKVCSPKTAASTSAWRRATPGRLRDHRHSGELHFYGIVIRAILLESMQSQDSGVYECVAQSNAGVVSETIDIQVNYTSMML